MRATLSPLAMKFCRLMNEAEPYELEQVLAIFKRKEQELLIREFKALELVRLPNLAIKFSTTHINLGK